MQEIFTIKNSNHIVNHRIYNHQENHIFAMHAHDFYEVIFVKRGKVKYSIENEVYYAKQNDLIIIQPFSYHFFQIEGSADYEKIGILFSLNTLPVNLHFIRCATKITLTENDIIYQLLNKLIYYYTTFPQAVFLELLKICTQEVIYNLSLIPFNENKENQHSKLIEDALVFINDNLFSIQSIQDVSNHLFVSKNYFSNVFSHEMNISVKSYIREKRLLHARTMLLSGKKASQIYTLVGFNSYPAFYRAYLARFGISPAETKIERPIKNSQTE